MPNSTRQEVREAVKALVEIFYPHRVETVRNFESDEEVNNEFCLIYFVEGDYVADGIQLNAQAALQVVFNKFGVSDDSELDVHENALASLLELDNSLGGVVSWCEPSGFSYVDTDNDRLSALALRFILNY